MYESVALSSEVLALDIGDLDLRNHKAKVTRKGSAVDIIVWQTGTARLLPRLLIGSTRGPVFLTDRKARVALAAADLDPVSGKARLFYRRAEEIFTELSGGRSHTYAATMRLTATAPPGPYAWYLAKRQGKYLMRVEIGLGMKSPVAATIW